MPKKLNEDGVTESAIDAQNVIHAQNVTVINNYGGEPEEEAAEVEDSDAFKAELKRQEEIAPGISNGLRPEVTRFAVAMEKKLTERDPKYPNGWQGDKQDELLARASNKFVSFASALKSDTATSNIRELGADIANYVMMLVDNAGALKAL